MSIFDIFKKQISSKTKEYLESEIQKNKDIQAYYNNIKDISGKNIAGGIPNESYNSSDITGAFSFPSQFAITCKLMDNSSVCSNILDHYSSTISAFKWDLTYKDKELLNDSAHQEVLELLKNQFESMGGIQYFISLAIREFMKFGLVLFTPVLEFKYITFQNKKMYIPNIIDLKTLDPQGIQGFFSSENNNNKVVAVRYISMPKALYDPETEQVLSGQSSSSIIDFNKSLSCLCSLNGREDPLGVPFLKDVWGQWRVLSNIDTSVNSNMISVGEHSYQFVPNQSFFDNINEIASVNNAINTFISNGGGVFVSPYGTLEKIGSIDLSKIFEYQEKASAEISRRKGMNIQNLGQSVGASANIAETAQADSITRGMYIANQFAYQFSVNFIKQYIDNTFKIHFLANRLRETPVLTFEAFDIKDELVTGIKEESLSIIDINKVATTIQTDDHKKTWIKGNLNNNESVVINTNELDQVLKDSQEKFEQFYLKEMKMYLNDTDRINRAIKDPNSVVNTRTLDRKQEEQFNSELNAILFGVVYSYFLEESKRYERALLVQGKTFEQTFNMNKEAFSSRETQKLLKKKEIKDFKRTQLASFINELDNTISNEVRRLGGLISENETQAFIQMQEDLSNIKGREFKALAPLSTMILFDFVNKKMIDSTKKDGMTLIRSGILEKQCEHCSKYMGAEYVYNGFEYSGALEYRNLPDSGCYGGDRCRCFYVKIPLIEINAMRGFQ